MKNEIHNLTGEKIEWETREERAEAREKAELKEAEWRKENSHEHLRTLIRTQIYGVFRKDDLGLAEEKMKDLDGQLERYAEYVRQKFIIKLRLDGRSTIEEHLAQQPARQALKDAVEAFKGNEVTLGEAEDAITFAALELQRIKDQYGNAHN